MLFRSHGRFLVPLTEKAGQRLLIPCLQLRDMHSKTHHYLQRLTGSTSGDCAEIVRNADGTESASEQLYQVVGAGTSTIESVPCAIALVELAQTDPNRCAILCANLGGDTDTIGAMATAICGALHGVNAIDPALKAELDAVNQLDFNRYATALAKYRQQREAI